MIADNNLSPSEREFLVQLRSLLLKCVDLIERRAALGKYKPSHPLPPSDTATFSGIIESAPRVDTATVEQKG